ncbi:MAG TPA: protein-L-isoaspartate(D-aspartate) O-methyltransferase [Thermoplasmata archaeon]|nr:protein-L-isoaspartate(D-aspartate) O-methyltransferase [Thermoplasmata archaeon]
MDGFESARKDLVGALTREGHIRSAGVERAFRTVPRERFVTQDLLRKAYYDTPLPIPMGQTISAPSMIAIMLEEADLGAGQKVLDVGTGSGYNAALLSEIVGSANVVSVERHADLAEFARHNLASAGYAGVRLAVADGTLGYEPEAPYDRIVVTAGAPRLARSWVRQTKVGGMIVAPIGRSTFSQVLVIATKTAEDRVVEREGTPCAFVPLVGKEGW